MDGTLLRCTCQDILRVWMKQLDRPVFSMDGVVACLDGDDDAAREPCLNVPLRDERIESSFGHCNVVEEITMETPSADEVDPFEDF